MILPSRAKVDAFCGSPATLYQRIAGVLAPVILLGSFVYLLLLMHTLPERIPSHYNTAGEITGYSSRGALLIMPAVALVTDLIMVIVGRFPQSWNVGVRVTVLNRARVYRLVRDLMADYRLALAVMFCGFAIYQSTLPEHFSSLTVVWMLLLSFAPLVRYLIRIFRRS